MSRRAFFDPPVMRLTGVEYLSLPIGAPVDLSTARVGQRWLEICWSGVRVREFRGPGPDGYLVETFRPIIRVQAVSRLVPRQQVV